MNAKDQVKVLNAGFTIIRMEVSTLRIKAKTKIKRDWHTLRKDFPSEAAMKRYMKELLENRYIIED